MDTQSMIAYGDYLAEQMRAKPKMKSGGEFVARQTMRLRLEENAEVKPHATAGDETSPNLLACALCVAMGAILATAFIGGF